MKPKFYALVLLLFSSLYNLKAQNSKAAYGEIAAKGDTGSTLRYIRNWQKTEPNNPEVYVAYVNIYANEGLKEVISLSTKKPAGDAFALKDKKNKAVGYLSGATTFNEPCLTKAFSYLDTGIAKFPNRLDIHFGKVYLLGRIKNYDAYTDEIVKTIDYGFSINCKWLWADNKTKPDGEQFMLSTVQSYVEQLFNSDENANHITVIAEAVLNHHPENVENLSNFAVSNMINKNYANALPPLLKAEKLAPNDFIVLNNIAYCYNEMSDKPNAIKYYELTAKYGDEEAKKQAIEKLAGLRKN